MSSPDDEGIIQGELDFDSGNTDGFENWKRQQDALTEALSYEWALPIAQVARIKLRGIKGEIRGKLLVTEPPLEHDRLIALKLRIGRVSFTSAEVEDWSIDDPAEPV